jgi:hypothetical protein
MAAGWHGAEGREFFWPIDGGSGGDAPQFASLTGSKSEV